jgi:16S rRNA (guanine527-N7)-methyltransferase
MFSSQQIEQLKEICSSFGVNLSHEMISKFQDYTKLLLDWNKRIHLVSEGDAKEDRIIRHLIDSLSVFKAVNIPQEAKIIDIGSGAGFPAIPIKIVRDDVKMTLVESVRKKMLFLRKAIDILKFPSAEMFDGRAEELVDWSDNFEMFDIATVRAVGRLKKIAPIILRFLRLGGVLVIYGSTEKEEKIHKLGLTEGFRLKGAVDFIEQSFHIKRRLLLIEKSNK